MNGFLREYALWLASWVWQLSTVVIFIAVVLYIIGSIMQGLGIG